MAKPDKKQKHSKNLLVLLYIAHVLPLACMSKYALLYIFYTQEDGKWSWPGLRNFHANFILDGWNDHIIQPARDAVLGYYQVRTPYLTLSL